MNLSLHAKQGLAFLTEATEVLYGGAAGGGKSHLMRVAAATWSALIPGLQVYLFRREMPDLLKNHMEGPSGFPAMLAPEIDAGRVRIHWSKWYIEFGNGSKIHLCHCQHAKDVLGYQGAEIHVLMPDELTQWEAGMYRYLRSRVRLGGLQLPEQYKGLFPRVLAGANPGGIGHNWVKAAWIDLAPPMAMTRMPKPEGGMLRQFIPARLEDNPTLVENDPDYEHRLEGLGDQALVRAMRHGDWNIVAGGMFDDVWDPAVHIVAPFEVPKTWHIDRSFDWGSSHPFSVGWWAESDGSDILLADGTKRSTQRGDLFRIAEWYGWNGEPNTGTKLLAAEVARGIKQREREMGLTVRPGPADSAIFDVVNGDSIADAMGVAGVHWVAADKSPGSRKTGAEQLRTRFKNASTREGPGLYVFETCRQFIRTIPSLVRDPNKPDDVDTKSEDHVYDDTRYRVHTPRREITRTRLLGA